ncbi:hypothetical protein [Mesorhizobium sp. M1396]|uniref:hypothetical protein n=1 Tax=Mesorhizobium sp. M1396 TaxID=2957095 RepID=UPI00333563C4
MPSHQSSPVSRMTASGLIGFAKLAPALLLAVLISAAVQQSTYALIPVFGASYGLAEAVLASLMMALSLGNIPLQIPLGLSTRTAGRYRWSSTRCW